MVSAYPSRARPSSVRPLDLPYRKGDDALAPTDCRGQGTFVQTELKDRDSRIYIRPSVREQDHPTSLPDKH